MTSDVQTNYAVFTSATSVGLMSHRGETNNSSGVNLPRQPATNQPFLPRIRVETCGLTVEARDRDSWKRDRDYSSKSWKPGKKRYAKHRSTSSLILNAQKMNARDGFLTRTQREAEMKAHTVRSERIMGYEKPSEFVGSLKVDGLPSNEETKLTESSRLGRVIRWPVGRLKYSTPSSTNSTSEASSSLPDKDAPPVGRLSPLSSSSIPLRSSEKVSPRERVIINNLAVKRKRTSLRGPLRRGRNGKGDRDVVNDIQSPINFDQYLPTTHCVNLLTETDVPAGARSRKTVLRGNEFYDIIDHATERLLEKHQITESTSSSSQCGTSGYGSSDQWPTSPYAQNDQSQNRQQSQGDFKFSDLGHLCPPNSPDFLTLSCATVESDTYS